MTEFILASLIVLICLYILSKIEIFMRYLDYTVNNLEKCLYHKQSGTFKYLLRTFAFMGCQGLGMVCLAPACDDTIDFWLRLLALAVGFGIFKMSADYFENAYSESIADFKIKI